MALASAKVVAVPCLGAGQAGLGEDPAEGAAVLGGVDRLGRGAHDRHAVVLERLRQAQRGLAAELHDHARDRAGQRLRVDDLQHVLERQRLEVQAVGGVVVRGDGLRVAVDHHGLVARVAQREGGVDAGVVELDALADAVRAGAQDDHRGLLARRRPRSPRRRRSRSTASSPRTRRRRCRPSCRPGGCRARAAPRGRRPRAGRGSRRSGRRRSRAAWPRRAGRDPACRRRPARPRSP